MMVQGALAVPSLGLAAGCSSMPIVVAGRARDDDSPVQFKGDRGLCW